MGEGKPNMGEVSDGYHTFDELYEHRHALFLALLSCAVEDAWFSEVHDDGSRIDGWLIVGTSLPDNISYHLPERFRETLETMGVEHMERAKPWDGHTSADVIKRLLEFATRPPRSSEVQP